MNWAVLRCASSVTMKLQEQLMARGAWTPMMSVELRGRHVRARKTVLRPLLPSFVFVPISELGWALKDNLTSTVKVRPFKISGVVVGIADQQLQPLREIELKLQGGLPLHRATCEVLPIGSIVKVLDGPFCGKLGIVESWNCGYCSVGFKFSTARYMVPPFLLHKVEE